MARCPFATWRPISGSSGPHLGGPYKIVHHTTEGSSAQGAMAAFRQNRSDPHFTVDGSDIYQHIDTAEGARALRNDAGGAQTNRDSAVQIELVGFAHLPKDGRALTNLARLCRWIEAEHGVPRVWPSGRPLPARNGRDPGGHNRDVATWDARGGHYGHCHVPENTHWDPAYSAAEADFLLAATFSPDGTLLSPPVPLRPAGKRAARSAAPASTMPDHAQVEADVVAKPPAHAPEHRSHPKAPPR
ncbi:N-acetylmuramoyl-L-alanine amidase [Achromobacter aegrifaciens]